VGFFTKLHDEIDLKKYNRFVFFVDTTGSRVLSFGKRSSVRIWSSDGLGEGF
jgi:hypothetical protein